MHVGKLKPALAHVVTDVATCSTQRRHLDDMKKYVPELALEFDLNSDLYSGINSGMNPGTYFFLRRLGKWRQSKFF